MTWAAIGAAVIGAGVGAAGAKKQRDVTKRGLANASAEQRDSLMAALAGTSEYQGIGKQGALNIGRLMGLEGFRTPGDVALREHIESRPSDSAERLNADNFRDGWADSKFTERASTIVDALGGVKSYFGKKKRKRAAAASAQNAAAAEQYKTTLAAWEAKKLQLEKQRDIELQSYDPTSALRATPGYDYRYRTGLATATGALNRNNMRQSGREQKEMVGYGQDFASNEYGNEFNRNLQLMSGGQSLAGLTGGWNIGQGNSLAGIANAQGQNNANYYSNLNNVAQGSLANYTYGQERDKDRATYGGRRSSSYDGTQVPNSVMANQPAYKQRNWWEQ